MVAIILYVGKAVSPKKKLIDFFGNFSIMLKCLSISKYCYVLAALSFAFFTYCPSLIVPHIYLPFFFAFESFFFHFSLPKMSAPGLLVKSYLYFAADTGWPTQKN